MKFSLYNTMSKDRTPLQAKNLNQALAEVKELLRVDSLQAKKHSKFKQVFILDFIPYILEVES